MGQIQKLIFLYLFTELFHIVFSPHLSELIAVVSSKVPAIYPDEWEEILMKQLCK